MELEISAYPAKEEHWPSLIGLGKTYYPSGHPALTEKFLKWFYLENPAGPAILIAAHENDLLIGLVVLIPVTLESAGTIQRACYAVNVLTHPDHRGKNLFVKMIRHARDYLSAEGIWLLGHPNPSAVPGWKRQKMEFRDLLHLYLAKFRFPFSSIREHEIRNLKQLRAIPDSFFVSLAERQDVHVQCYPEYIQWRFLDAPHKEYRVVAVESHGEFLGLRITRKFKGPVDLAVDFIAPIKSIKALLSSLRRPTLIMHSGVGAAGSVVNDSCWRLPIKRQFPFFVSTWENVCSHDMNGITLAASDF